MMRQVALAAAALIVATTIPTAAAAGFDNAFTCNQASLTADFAQRDALPHTEIPPGQWYQQRDGHYLNGGWGPNAAARILSAALHYVNDGGNPQGLQYRHHHIQVRQRDGWYRTAVLGGWRPISG